MWELQCLLLQEVFMIMSSLCLWGGADLNLLREEVRLYSCTPRNFSVSLREELTRTDAIFWPSCLLVKRCGGNCACCSHRCYDCQCVPARVTKKYHEVNINMLIILRHLPTVVKFWNECQFRIKHFTSRVIFLNYLIHHYNIFPTDISSETIFFENLNNSRIFNKQKTSCFSITKVLDYKIILKLWNRKKDTHWKEILKLLQQRLSFDI